MSPIRRKSPRRKSPQCKSLVQRNCRQGISMIEVMASTLIVSTILIVSLTASSNLMRSQAVANSGVDGKLLACRFLDEVTSLDFKDWGSSPVFGPETDELAPSRALLDDMDDYHGLVISPPTDRQGLALGGYSNWSVTISVSPADPTPTGFVEVANDEAPLRRVAVVCTSPSGTVTTIRAIVSQTQSTLNSSIAHQRHVNLSLSRAGSAELKIVTPLRNRPSVSGL